MAIIVSQNGKNAKKVEQSDFAKEDYLQKYIYDNPESIPLYDIKEDIRLLILAREFSTDSGPIDAIGIDVDGEIYIIETKLYKNPDKRKVVAQLLDYGAALWTHSNDFIGFSNLLDAHVQKTFKLSLRQKLQDYFGLSDEELDQQLDAVKNNLQGGSFRFVVLMDVLNSRLKDLILYVNRNSQFTIYAVELEYYKHDSFEIVIPRIHGAEVKKELQPRNQNGKLWDWDLFRSELKQYGPAGVKVAEQIIAWSKQNQVEISWSKSQIGSFIMGFYTKSGKGFYPFSVKSDARIEWNAPHQRNKSPQPFNQPEKRAEILKRLGAIKGATVDTNNVDGYKGLSLSLSTLTNQTALREFFSVCSWIKENLESE